MNLTKNILVGIFLICLLIMLRIINNYSNIVALILTIFLLLIYIIIPNGFSEGIKKKIKRYYMFIDK